MLSFLDKIKAAFASKSSTFGLNITDEYVQVLQLDSGGKVKGIGERKIPVGTVVKGRLVQEKLLAKDIQTVIKDSGVRGSNCVVALPESQVYEHIFYLPIEIKGEEFKKALDKLVEETIPMHFHEVKYDYKTTTHGKINVVATVAVKREIIAQYYEVIRTYADLTPVILEPASLSLLRNIPIEFAADKGTILLNIEKQSTEWFALWSKDVFDSSSVEKSDISTGSKELIKDILNAQKSFESTTKRNITSILVSGSKAEADALVKQIAPTIKTPITVVEKLKLSEVSVEGKTPENFKIVAGLALAKADKDAGKINLLK